MKTMWRCPACARSFAIRNQTHSCGTLTSLDVHFEHSEPRVRILFERFLEEIRTNGPVEILPEKTRIAFHVRMSFAMVVPRRDVLTGHLVLARRVEDSRFHRIETFSPRNHVHHFRIGSLEELDEQFAAWIAEAYAVGEQRHLD